MNINWGELVTNACKNANMSIKELSEKSGVSMSSIYRIENGGEPTINIILKIAKVIELENEDIKAILELSKRQSFGKVIRRMRQERCLSVRELGKLADVSEQIIFYYEAKDKSPAASRVVRIYKALIEYKVPCTVGNYIRALRLKNALTQEELAKQLNITKGTIQKIESGRYQTSRKTLCKIKELFSTYEQNS